ncbi:MAG: thioredoxin [Candidatus Diapherotrites archaeon]
MSKPLSLSDSTFEKAVFENKLIVVDFWAEWCSPCQIVGPLIEQLAEEYAGKIVFAKLNVDESPLTAQKFSVMSIPTILVFKNGKPVEELIGSQPKKDIENAFKPYLK